MNLALSPEHHAKVEEFRRQQRTGILVLLFTDMIASTRIKQDLGDQKGVAVIRQHHALLRQLLSAFTESKEIDTAGDGFFIAFVKPSDAVKFALLTQAAVRRMALDIGYPIADRIGIHAGEVLVEERADSRKPMDLFGIQVDSSARVMSLAQPSQILMTRFVFDNARQLLKGEEFGSLAALSWLNHGSYLLKGVEEPLEICEVGEIGVAPLARPADSDKAQRHIAAGGEPVLGWRPAVEQAVPNSQWLLERKLGEGGFGEVWLARHEKLKERRVFKFCFHAERVRSLKREVTLFRLLKERVGAHPNIVGIQDVYFDEPPFYIVMDYAEGKDLTHWIEAQGGAQKVPLESRLEIVAQVADALQAAHEAGIIHRDVKPSNIIVSGTQPGTLRVRLTDFGIGQLVSQDLLTGMTRGGFTMTITGSDTGTPLYMAPELLGGKPASTRSDIYSLGVVLYQFLVGDMTRPAVTDWARDIENPLLKEDLTKCLAGNPQDRFPAAQDLAQQLRKLPDRQLELERNEAELKAKLRAAYRKGVMRAVAVGVGVVALMAALAGFALHQSKLAKRDAKNAEIQTGLAKEFAGAAQTASAKLSATLAASDFDDAVRMIAEGNPDDALAYLARSLRLNPTNDAVAVRLWTLLTYHSWLAPTVVIRHGDRVRAAEFSPDGERLVTASSDETARIWNATTGLPLTPPMKHANRVYSARFSRDGKRILTTSSDGAYLWDAQTAQPVIPTMKLNGGASFAEFSGDGNRILATSFTDGRIYFFDAQNGNELGAVAEQFGRKQGFTTARLSADGKRIATGSEDSTARLWDAATRQPISPPLKHDGPVSSVAFSPDGKLLLTASQDRTARLWDTQTGAQVTPPLKHRDVVLFAEFSADGLRVVTASSDESAQVWDARTGNPISEPLHHRNSVHRAQFSPDGKKVATASWDRTAAIWDMQQGGFPKAVGSVPTDRPVELWDAQPVRDLNERERQISGVNSGSFSRDGKWMLTISTNREARVWDTQSGKPLAQPMTQEFGVSFARLSPDGKRALTVGGDTLLLWDAQTGQRLSKPLRGEGSIQEAQFSADGNFIFECSEDAYTHLWEMKSWDVRSNETVANRIRFGREALSAHFSPDGHLVVTASTNHHVQVWDSRTGFPLSEPIKYDQPITSAKFSADGRELAVSIAGDKKVYLTQMPSMRGPVPDWLAPLAEAIAGELINDQLEMESARMNPAQTISKIREQLEKAAVADDWVTWGRWFLADPSVRSPAPPSKNSR